MTESNAEPVEISTRMRPGEWTQESMAELTGSYQRKLMGMGAPEAEIETEVDHADDGSARVRVSWLRRGVHNYANLNQNDRDRSGHTYANLNQAGHPEDQNARGDGEAIPPGESSKDSQGLGSVLGDADRSAIDEPPAARAVEAEKHQQVPNAIIYTNAEGETYLEETSKEQPE